MAGEPKCPFSSENQLNHKFNSAGPGGLPPALPGQPLVRLDNAIRLGDFLESEYVCEDLEKMAPLLWMLSTQSSSNIRPLHRQRVVGREILITESPRLHLVWYYDRVFIKPLPEYLMSHSFWTTYLLSESSPLGSRRHHIRRAALGFIRTYRHIVKHESDFRIAQEEKARLIPSDITWHQFCAFISEFDEISDAEVSGRYRYGELRLTRLNFYGMFILHKVNYEHLPTQYATYFSRYFGPLLFAFAAISLELSAMQVEISVEQVTGTSLRSVRAVYRWFSVVVMLAGITVSTFLCGYAVYMIADEWIYALRARRKRLPGEQRRSENVT
jgi:hypothetical protein